MTAKLIQLSVQERTYAGLAFLAGKKGMTVNTYVRKMVEVRVEKHEKELDGKAPTWS